MQLKTFFGLKFDCARTRDAFRRHGTLLNNHMITIISATSWMAFYTTTELVVPPMSFEVIASRTFSGLAVKSPSVILNLAKYAVSIADRGSRAVVLLLNRRCVAGPTQVSVTMREVAAIAETPRANFVEASAQPT